MSILPSAQDKATYVNRMFAEIAPRYDLMNRLMTGWQDRRWRRDLVQLCEMPPHGALLDVGTGTGDIVHEAVAQCPGIHGVGGDFTYEMMAVGRRRATRAGLPFVQMDGLHLPFPDASFDAVASGFFLRNVVDIDLALQEQVRVAKPGGRVACLETLPPDQTWLGPLFRLYFFAAVPALGALVGHNGRAYRYLPQSTVYFPGPDELARRMERAGLRHVFYVKRMLGTVAIHVGMA